jgi:hypothetical protein
MSTTTPTTTYPFTFTTYFNSLPATTFSKPTIIPSIFSWGPGLSCSANSQPTPQPSQFPIDRPLGLEGACVISNAREINDHAFWDLYDCCKSKNMTAFGSSGSGVCTAQCRTKDAQTWQELGECLAKRVEVVVCKPPFDEIAKNGTNETSGSSGTTASRTASRSGSTSSTHASGSTGAGNVVAVAHVGNPKSAMMVFVILAVGSFAGMLL